MGIQLINGEVDGFVSYRECFALLPSKPLKNSVHNRLLFLFLLLFILSCNSDPDFAAGGVFPTPEVVIRNGGYSWWSGPYLAEFDDKLLITGVGWSSKSIQWVSSIEKNDEDTLAFMKKNVLKKVFIPDEHNSPAIVNHNNKIVLAMTGHSDEKPSVKNRIFIFVGETLETLNSYTLNTPAPSTYVQLFSIDGSLILFSRIANSLSYAISNDDGETWSGWSDLFISGYVDIDYSEEDKKFYFYFGTNPSLEHSFIYSDIGYFTGTVISVDDDSQNGQTAPYRVVDLNLVYQPAPDKSVRILSSYSSASVRLILFAEHMNPTFAIEETWDLKLAVLEDEQVNIIDVRQALKGVLGERNSIINQGFYVYGATLEYQGDHKVNIIYAHQTLVDYKISELMLDLDTQQVLENDLISSMSELYRPNLYKISTGERLLMFNKANKWKDYTNWRSVQYLKILD